MIRLYFGLPRSGKTTLFARIALETSKKIDLGKSPYTCICGNVDLKDIPHYKRITFDMLGKYDFRGCLILIDEATIECDSRNYKVWNKDKTEFFVLHGHYKCSIFLFTQIANRIDKTIRYICNDVYYMWKPFLLGLWFTRCLRIPYGISLPKKGEASHNADGEITMGYFEPSFILKLFAPYMFRPKYYKYFDSWEAAALPPIPEISWRDGEAISESDFVPEYTAPSIIDIRSVLR